jgi:hypothetical protein
VATISDACATNNVAVSNALAITVNPSVTPTVSLSADKTTICSGGTVNFSTNSTNAGTAPSYQWFKNGSLINGLTNSTYSASSIANGDQYSVTMASNAACALLPNVYSNLATITVTPTPTPSISIDPSVGSTNVNHYYTPNLVATIQNGGSTPTIQWYKNGALISGANQATYISNIPIIDLDKFYATIVSNQQCAPTSPTSSNTLTFKVIVSVEKDIIKELSYYPNPSSNLVTVDASEFESVKIYNQLGVMVLETKNSQFDISSLTNGVYTLILEKDGYNFVGKLEKN